jgi:hypothetical protein
MSLQINFILTTIKIGLMFHISYKKGGVKWSDTLSIHILFSLHVIPNILW